MCTRGPLLWKRQGARRTTALVVEVQRTGAPPSQVREYHFLVTGLKARKEVAATGLPAPR